MTKLDLKFETHLANDWPSFVRFLTKRFDNCSSFIFRGQAIDEESPWIFQTELERAFVGAKEGGKWKSQKDPQEDLRNALKTKLEKRNVQQIEDGLVREFRRQSSLYLRQQVLPEHRLEWLALMRHYGAPTRLLDWTYSIYVAAFFALDGSSLKKPAAIWAFDTAWLETRMSNIDTPGNGNLWNVFSQDTHLQRKSTWDDYFRGSYTFVLPVNRMC